MLSAANENESSIQSHSLYEEVDYMLRLVEVMYAFAEVRRVAKSALKKFQEKYYVSDRIMKEMMNAIKFYSGGNTKQNKLELKRLFMIQVNFHIMDSEIDEVVMQFNLLSLPKSLITLEKDFNKNMNCIREKHFPDIKSAEQSNSLLPESLVFHTIGDDFLESKDDEATWVIVIDKQKKRITLVFQGATDVNDFRASVRIGLNDMKLHGPRSNDPVMVNVHKGFYNYLYEDKIVGSDQITISQAETILENLFAIFALHEDYNLYVTGHSVGAALSTLFSFRAAYDSGIPNKPIINISFGSPYVGNWEFRKHFQELEKEGKIRHLRVSNEGDVVPLALNLGLLRGLPVLYKHVGLNLKLYRNEGFFRKSFLKISYPKPGSLASSIYWAWDNNILRGITCRSTENHRCVEYRNRLNTAKNALDKLRCLEHLYKDKNITCSLFNTGTNPSKL